MIANHTGLSLSAQLSPQDFGLGWSVGCSVHRTLRAESADVGDASAGILTGRLQVLSKTYQPSDEI